MADDSRLTQVQVWAAVLIFGLFTAFAIYVVFISNSATDAHWSRTLVIFSSIEALGFAAAGLLLGQQISASTARRLEEVEEKNKALAESKLAAERAKIKAIEAARGRVEAAIEILSSEVIEAAGGSPETASSEKNRRHAALKLLEKVIEATDVGRQS